MATLSVGSSGEDVTQVQLLLRALGIDAPITGVYDAATRDGVIAWQQRLNAPATGDWDPNTHTQTLDVLARPGGAGGPLLIPPRPTRGLDLDRWGIERQYQQAVDTSGPGTVPADNVDGMVLLNGMLDRYGLGGLKGWAKDLLVKGTTPEEVRLLLEETPEFKARFPYNDARRANGFDAMDPEQMLQYENTVQELMVQAGFPPGFYDGPEDFVDFLSRNVSPIEIQERINDGYRQVSNAHPSVRQAFRDYFGIEGDVALAMLFVGGDKSQDAVIRMAEEAKVAASARRMDFSVSRPLVEEMVRVGVTADDSSRLFTDLSKMRAVFDEQLGEGDDLEAEDVARQEFGLGGDGASRLEQRRIRRVNAGSGVGGGAELEAGLQLGRADE